MFWMIVAILVCPWLLGLVISCATGEFIHLLRGGRPHRGAHRDY